MQFSPRQWCFSCVCALALLAAPARAEVYIEQMTWPEVQQAIESGKRTVIVPTGGTEQNGPHIEAGKHNTIVHYTAGEIARQLGNALAAPVLPYVPEGRVNPPEGHMRFPGTISVTDEAFGALLEDIARSLRQHGFDTICFIGDHGGNQKAQQAVADKLNAEWRGMGARVIQVSDYYANNGQKEWAAERGIKALDPAAHAGFMDTSEMLALNPGAVRVPLVSQYRENSFTTTGVAGDPREGTPEYGKKLLSLKVEAAVQQIRRAQGSR